MEILLKIDISDKTRGAPKNTSLAWKRENTHSERCQTGRENNPAQTNNERGPRQRPLCFNCLSSSR